MTHLVGKVVVVTGAAGGFGRRIAGMVHERDAVAVGIDVDGPTLAATFADLAATGNRGDGLEVDVCDRDAMASAIDRVVSDHGRVDVLVNNAGVMPLALLADHERAADAWDQCIDINLKGVLHGIYAVYDHMIRQGAGHIVNMSSIYGNAGVAVYSATKAAVAVVSNALRVEAQGAIKVTMVRPTGVPGTNLASGIIDFGAAAVLSAHNARAVERERGEAGDRHDAGPQARP